MRIAPPSALAVWLVTAGSTAVSVKAKRAVEMSFMVFPMPEMDQSRTAVGEIRTHGPGVEFLARAHASESTGAAARCVLSALYIPPPIAGLRIWRELGRGVFFPRSP